MSKVGAMTVAKNDEATIAFVIGATLPYVDHYIYFDTGSTDRSMRIVQELFKSEIAAGKLGVYQKDVGTAIWQARQLALGELQLQDIDFFLKLDGDDVCYDRWIREVSVRCQFKTDEINNVWVGARELYQWKAETSVEWLTRLLDKSNQFYEMTKHNSQHYDYGCPSRIQNTHDAYAKGNWCDESQGKGAEGIYHNVSRGETRWNVPLVAHYGWARPMKEKQAKAAVRYGEKKDWSERVQDLHQHPHHLLRGLIKFDEHPEIFRRLGPKVLELLKEI
jgi:hypothetical protein